MNRQGRLTVAGSIAQKPHQAGHSWQFLQYLLGFRRLGWDVLFLDRLEGAEGALGLRYLADLMSEFDLADSWSAVLDGGGHAGLPRDRVLEHVRESDLGQMWRALELADVFAGHDRHVTIGERIGSDDCAVPTCGLDWITTPQPVVLEQWPAAPPPARRDFTTVGRWRGAYGPIDYDGRRYGLRVHEFRKFADLPRMTDAHFELALDIHPDETPDLDLLGNRGWDLVDPRQVGATASAYRGYIEGSAAEFMVAKGMYVESRSGWFSERSICYLATGRPVLAQDTGLADLYPVGEGLLVYSTLEQAVEGVEELRSDHRRHALADREIAVAHFDSDKVLDRLLARLGTT